MKKPSTHLFQMIKALTPAEKRYFKIYASKHVIGKKNNYEKLFDDLDDFEQTEYNEALFLESNRRKPYARYFADEKKHLEELLLEAMRNYNGSKSASARLNDMLADERFCRDKRLNDLRLKIIAKAKELAYYYERWYSLLELLEREVVAVMEVKQSDLISLPITIENEMNRILSVCQLTVALKNINNRIFSLVRQQTGAPSPKTLAEVNKLAESDIVTQYVPGQYFSLDSSYYRILILQSRLQRNFTACHNYNVALLNCYDQYPHFKENIPGMYKIDLFNYLNSCHNVQQYSRFEEVINSIKHISCTTLDEEGEDWQNIVHFRLMHYLGKGEFAAAAAMYTEISTGLRKYATKVNAARRITLQYNLFQSFFMLEHWSMCLDCLTEIIRDESHARLDLKHLSEFFLLIIQYELGNYTVAGYNAQNLKRRIYKSPLVTDGDIAFIRYFEAMNPKSGTEKINVLKKMLQLFESPQGTLQLLKNEEILIYWLKSRINQTSLVKAMHPIA